jgi:general secretion pathway protein K
MIAPAHERGAALLTVLLLVAVMAVVSATAVERLTLATRLQSSAAAMAQARLFAIAGEQLALRRIDRALADADGQVTADGGWLGRDFTLPLPGGSARMTLADGGNCFNLNSLASDAASGGAARPVAVQQFASLMLALGVGESEAQHIAASAADWIDADQAAADGGAEDAAYRAGQMGGDSGGYRTGDTAMTDAAEIAAVAGVTPAIRQRIAPWLCALPAHDLSPLNVNTLRPDQAPLLQMLLPGKLSPAQAARPIGGYGSVTRFWTAPTLAGVTPVGDAATQVGVTTRWFRLKTVVRLGDVTLASEALIDAGTAPARVVRRTWGPDA